MATADQIGSLRCRRGHLDEPNAHPGCGSCRPWWSPRCDGVGAPSWLQPRSGCSTSTRPGRSTLVEAAAGGDAVADDERYDTIICTCRLISVPDLLRATTGVARLLAADGDLHLIEPVNHPGSIGLVTSSAGPLLRLSGLHLARDVPAAVRATGLTMVDLERFTIPTLVWPLRRFIEARACFVTAGVGA